MGDSLSWAADQEYEAEQRRKKAYRETPEFKAMLEIKKAYELLIDRPLPPVNVRQIEFLMEKPRYSYEWEERTDVKFYSRERLERAKTIYGFYDLDL